MGTHVRLTRSGGLAGISMVAEVDVDELPPPTAERVRTALAEVDFGPAPGAGDRPGMPDSFQYDLVVRDQDTRAATAQDPFLSPGFRAVVDVLMPLAQPE